MRAAAMSGRDKKTILSSIISGLQLSPCTSALFSTITNCVLIRQ